MCKDYLTKKESDGVLHQMTGSPQSPNLNQTEMVWNELDCRLKEKQTTSAQYLLDPRHDCWKSWLRECEECAKLSSEQTVAI